MNELWRKKIAVNSLHVRVWNYLERYVGNMVSLVCSYNDGEIYVHNLF